MSRKKRHRSSSGQHDKPDFSTGIIAVIKRAAHGISAAGIARKLNLPRRDIRRIHHALKRLEHTGVIVRSGEKRFSMAGESAVRYKGILRRTFSGAGSLIPEGGGPKITISRLEVGRLLDGDEIEVRLTGIRKDKPRGAVVRLIRRRSDPVVGYYQRRKNGDFVVPLDPRICRRIRLSPPPEKRPLHNAVVSVRPHPSSNLNEPVTAVLEAELGERDAFGVETAILVRKHHIRDEMPPEVMADADAILERVDRTGEVASRYREDYRDVHVITVDPENARDFDDGLSLERLSGGYRLGVHIADVSHYVPAGSRVDQEAYDRGTSVYLPERAIHMLPEHLATDVCSLKPDEDRLTVTVWIDFDDSGRIRSGRLSQGIIRSRARLTYAQFLAASEGRPPAGMSAETAALCRDLANLCRRLLERRIQRGVLDLDIPEAEFEFDGNGRLIGIHKKQRSIAEQTIEAFMIAANVVVAEFLDGRSVPYIRRVHEPPDPDEISGLRESLARLGIKPPTNPLDPDQVREMLSRISSPGVRSVASYLVLRSMRRAVYSATKQGHFGLALETYTQFTSPIRRYPDLEVHRAVKAALKIPGYRPTPTAELEKRAKWLSDRERAAQEAEWEAAKLRKIRFMQDHLHEVFSGVVINVEPFGAFVEIEDPFVEGMIPISKLRGHYRYSARRNALISPDGQTILKPGVTLDVELVTADIDRGILDFIPPGTAKKPVSSGDGAKKSSPPRY